MDAKQTWLFAMELRMVRYHISARELLLPLTIPNFVTGGIT
jgi:hypothetical protein